MSDLEQKVLLSRRTPPAVAPVRVRVLQAKFFVGDRVAVVGEIIPLPPDVASSLVFTGKAALVDE